MANSVLRIVLNRRNHYHYTHSTIDQTCSRVLYSLQTRDLKIIILNGIRWSRRVTGGANSVLGSFVVTLREGVEAALIISILLAYLARTGNKQHLPKILLGAGLALLTSAVAGVVLFMVMGDTEGGPAEQIIAAFAMLLAAGTLTYMVFWMRKIARNMKKELQERVDQALHSNSLLALTTLAFVSIIRDGVETVLFLIAVARAERPMQVVSGSLLGLAVAAVIGYLLYKGSSVINIRAFFDWTGLFLIIVAAGLLAGAVREFHDLGWLPRIVSSMWDTSGILSEESTVGGLVKSMFGYDSSPSLLEVIAHLGYLGIALITYFNPFHPAGSAAPAATAAATKKA